MSKIENPAGFEIDDIITRILPGGVVVFSMLFVIIEIDPFSIGTTGFVVSVFVSFIIGEIIEYTRHSVYRHPRSFSRLIYRTTQDREHLYNLDSYTLQILDCLSIDIPQVGTHPNEIPSRRQRLVPPWAYADGYFIEHEYDGDLVEELAESNPLPGDDYLPEHLHYHLMKQVRDRLNKSAQRRHTFTILKTNLNISFLATAFSIIVYSLIWALTEPEFLLRENIGFGILFILSIIIVYGLAVLSANILLSGIVGAHVADLLREYTYVDEKEQYD